ncbi:MAG: smc [Cytophagaceae bacterium]|jgi:chromosome segregation protein|nr:smc [Cytophagaceae bacterium]
MQLSKLEIKGFKSFGDKVLINFDEGITGIVGPNGCGKSNVVDAIRWVLGEQKTRALRSDKMENVIFNGTRNRKPSQMAEVSLTFNNTKNILPTEYSQVTISRRYYRSGESEYLLNNVTCRLKDITNLFLDTGIGSDSYAIIELKMVEDILNDKNNSRRELFEEAAGISKYKVRKKESLNKLSDTDKDLERVEDLLFEINKNMRSLEKQAKQTEKYFQAKDEYKQISLDLAKVSVSTQREDLQNLQQEVEQKTDLKLQLSASINEKESSIESTKLQQVDQEKVLASRQKALNEHVDKIRKYESEKTIKNERLTYLNRASEKLNNELEQDQEHNNRAGFAIDSITREKESSEKILAETEVRVQQLKQEYEDQKSQYQQLQEEATVINNQFKRKQEEVFNLNKTIEINQIQLSTLKQELEKTASDSSQQEASMQDFETKINEVNARLVEKAEVLAKIEIEENKIQTRIAELEKEIDSSKESLTQFNRSLDAKQNEFSLTKSMVENLEGFPEAIKFLKKNSSWGKNAPLLSDVITCDEKYRLSIENYLESFMNYYIVEQESHAYQAVNLLSDAAKGKANFFILNKFESFKPAPKKSVPNAIYALDIVDVDKEYRHLAEFLLNNVYIVTENQDNLTDQGDAVLITVNGKISKREFSISGGSVGLFEGKRIGRAKNLEKLEVDIKQLTQQIEALRAKLDTQQQEFHRLKAATRKLEIDNLQTEINLINQEMVAVTSKKEQLASMLSNNSMKSEEMLERIAKLEEDITQKQPLSIEERSNLEALEEKLVYMNEALQEQNEILSNKSSAYNQENIIFHQQQNKLSSLEQEISFKQASFDQSKERIDNNTKEAERIKNEIQELLSRTDVNEDELVELYKEKELIESGLQEAERSYYGLRSQTDGIDSEIREIRRKRDETEESLSSIQTRLTETRLGLTSLKERLAVEFDTDLDELLNQQEAEDKPLGSLEELQEKVTKIKASMERMGPINPMAMEAYQEIKERGDFIGGQKQDLVNAKESLLSTISEIDNVAKDTFFVAFEQIRENFKNVFRSLFTEEDKCDLKLVDPSNPLDSEIEIMAQPKGKRPLTINQLSGGEKTLTAISLLFSIYLLKPAPFCIFDEVDAPLDDVNIDKFNNIIRKFSGESQFIIVTHNKRTMSSTDVIYGITMIEQGVSRLVPVDLRELA